MMSGPAGAYALLMIVGILVTAWMWSRVIRRDGWADRRFTIVYFAGLIGALLGAKVAFLTSEGWAYRGDWIALLSGRSITGALLGGYGAVEIAKRRLGYTRTTGDLFAIVVPIGLVLGRFGCLLEGCCPGVECGDGWWVLVDAQGAARWPIVPMEIAFNAGFLAWVLLARRCEWTPGNRFHVYLIAYGLFRFGTEFIRDNAPLTWVVTGYHLWAMALVAFGLVRFRQRLNEQNAALSRPVTTPGPDCPNPAALNSGRTT